MDIYSLGSLLWEIMSEQIPYSNSKDNLQLVNKIKNEDYREKNISCPYEYIDLNLFASQDPLKKFNYIKNL